jgi:hypothetical protein
MEGDDQRGEEGNRTQGKQSRLGKNDYHERGQTRPRRG